MKLWLRFRAQPSKQVQTTTAAGGRRVFGCPMSRLADSLFRHTVSIGWERSHIFSSKHYLNVGFGEKGREGMLS